jgi:Resolvase, N terminal domain
VDGFGAVRGMARSCPENDRLGVMTGILGYARVSTSDQDVAGQSMRLTEAGAIKVFTDVRSGRTMARRSASDWPGTFNRLSGSQSGRHPAQSVTSMFQLRSCIALFI